MKHFATVTEDNYEISFFPYNEMGYLIKQVKKS